MHKLRSRARSCAAFGISLLVLIASCVAPRIRLRESRVFPADGFPLAGLGPGDAGALRFDGIYLAEGDLIAVAGDKEPKYDQVGFYRFWPSGQVLSRVMDVKKLREGKAVDEIADERLPVGLLIAGYYHINGNSITLEFMMPSLRNRWELMRLEGEVLEDGRSLITRSPREYRNRLCASSRFVPVDGLRSEPDW